jgi:uncharacterized protein YgiM (DUF1202 family)
MKHRTVLFFGVLVLAILACKATGNAPSAQAMVMSLPISTRAPPIATTPHACRIRTGVEAGKVNMRTCGGTRCPSVTILHEGETLTRSLLHPVDGWIPVRNSKGLNGWVNSKYITCPPRENKARKK